MPTVLIGPSELRHRPGRFREILEAAGFTPVDPEGPNVMNAGELLATLPTIDALIAGGEVMSARMLDNAPRLRVIARTGVGYDTIDVAAATARGVVLTTTPGTNHDSVAEQVFGLLLGLTRRIVDYNRIIQDGGWERKMVRPLRGTTLGLVGLGRIGRAVALKALAFGMHVAAFDSLADADFDARHSIKRLALDDLLAASDVVSLHLPLTDQTRGLFGRETFDRMKPGSILINTARGGLVVEADLRNALVSGRLYGAGLDVLNNEPPEPGNPLLGLPNVIISPHVGGVDTTSMADMAELAAQCVVDLHQGRWPARCVINGELAEGWTW